jgi:CheY-like chemotaxis protein
MESLRSVAQASCLRVLAASLPPVRGRLGKLHARGGRDPMWLVTSIRSVALRGLNCAETQPVIVMWIGNVERNMSRKKILIVDDSQVILRTLSSKLRANNYDIVTAADGSEAVSAVRQQRPDLIVLDITFPPDVAHGGGIAWDGFLIIEWLHRMEEAKNTPIVIITAGEAGKFKERALAEGAVAFFQKPIDSGELLATINQTLEGQKAEPAPAG